MSTPAMLTTPEADKNLALAFVAMAAGERCPLSVKDTDTTDVSVESSTSNAADEDSLTKRVNNVIGNDPINEFTHMPQILSGAFPHEFPFGVCAADLGGPASLKKRVMRRLTRLYDGRVSHNYHLLIYLGNMLLRHSSCAATSARVELEYSDRVLAVANDPGWDDRASNIIANPDGEEAKKLGKEIAPWVRLAGCKVCLLV